MLAQGLAIAVAIGSILLFLTAFLFPKLHRQDDFFWSAVGLFYALILWVCAGQMVGAILLGQLASVVLLGWFAWETLRLRQAIIDPAKIPNLDKVSLVGYVKEKFKRPPAPPKAKKPVATTPKTDSPTTEKTAETETSDAESPKAEAPQAPEIDEASPETTAEETTSSETTTVEPEVTPEVEEEPVTPETTSEAPEIEAIAATEPAADITEEKTVEAATAPSADIEKKGFSFGRIFGRKEKETPAEVPANPQNLDDIFEETSEATEVLAETEPEAIASAPEILTDVAPGEISPVTSTEDTALETELTSTETDSEQPDETETEKKEDS